MSVVRHAGHDHPLNEGTNETSVTDKDYTINTGSYKQSDNIFIYLNTSTHIDLI